MLRNLTVIATLAFTLLACSSTFQTVSDYNPDVNFQNFRTFSFMPEATVRISSAETLSPLLADRLVAAAVRELQVKGLQLTNNAEDADIVLSFSLGTRDEISVTSMPSAYRRPYGWGGAYYNNVDVNTYTNGTLAIDIFDGRQRQPIWHGRASKRINDSDRDNVEVVNTAVAAILAQYPPSLTE